LRRWWWAADGTPAQAGDGSGVPVSATGTAVSIFDLHPAG